MMTNAYVVQLVGVILSVAGLIALMASMHLFGIPPTPAEKRRASDEWNRREDARRLPVNLETIMAILLLSGGIAILVWSKFSPCGFLAYWLPSLPAAARLLLSCR